jgi:hypothetical protein
LGVIAASGKVVSFYHAFLLPLELFRKQEVANGLDV